MSKGRFTVRFNLGRGENYQKWQIRNLDTNEMTYHDPATTILVLYKCELRNSRATATKIFEGARKDVCAWVQCHRVVVMERDPMRDTPWSMEQAISYNPRIAPHWRDIDGANLDGHKPGVVHTWGRQMYWTTSILDSWEKFCVEPAEGAV